MLTRRDNDSTSPSNKHGSNCSFPPVPLPTSEMRAIIAL